MSKSKLIQAALLTLMVSSHQSVYAHSQSLNEASVIQSLQQGDISSFSLQHLISQFDSESELLTFLADLSADGLKSNNVRSHALFLSAKLKWRGGETDQALALVEKALTLAESTNSLLLRARLFDAKGKRAQAFSAYQAILNSNVGVDTQNFIKTRLSLATSLSDPSRFAEFAKSQNINFKRGAAVALALKKQPELALSIYDIESNDDKSLTEYLRVTTWAIQAEEFEKAKELAWKAYQSAKTNDNKKYSLALLQEAHRKSNSLRDLVDFLATYSDDSLISDLAIDSLIELKRFDEAISLLSRKGFNALTPEQRIKLIDLYEQKGKSELIVAQFERLIASERAEVAWYKGLAAHYLTKREQTQAKKVWARFEANNKAHTQVLLSGASAMVDMGLQREAINLLKRLLDTNKNDTTVMFALFETFLGLGQDDKAVAQLEEIRLALSPTSSLLKEVADGFERVGRLDKSLEIYQMLMNEIPSLGYDEKLRLAWLYSVNDNKAKALEIYQRLWTEIVSPARRTFIEAQFLLLAAELNKLGDIVVGLEEDLYAGSADSNDINLLTRIYIEANDIASAEDVIEEYFANAPLAETQKLHQLSKVYLMLQDYDAYDGVLRRLIDVEPQFTQEHIRKLILNLLANSNDKNKAQRLLEVEQLLAKLKLHSQSKSVSEFEAGVMKMLGKPELAIEHYKSALQHSPDKVDNLLLLTELMGEHGEHEKAVSMLQYVAEYPNSDNEFVVAVDGLVNLLGTKTQNDRLDDTAREVLSWLETILLQKITSSPNKFYLYSLLAEIQQELDDLVSEVNTIDNSLAVAGVRRASVLRELITLVSSAGGNAYQFKDNLDNKKRDLGRRLIALNKELPPEIYIDIARSLLQSGDLIGASKSFSRINDVTGMINVSKLKAVTYQETGYAQESLKNYESALSTDQSDYDALLNAGGLREVEGDKRIANQWYWLGLRQLLRQQKRKINDGIVGTKKPLSTMVDRDYRQYYNKFFKGFILTLPDNSKQLMSLEDSMFEMLNAEIAAAISSSKENSKGNLGFEHYSRIYLITTMMLDTAVSMSNLELLTRTYETLTKGFANDGTLLAYVNGKYRLLGLFKNGIERSEDNESPVVKAMSFAKKSNDYELLIALYRIQGNSSDIEELLIKLLSQGNYQTAFELGLKSLTTEQFKRIFSGRIYTNEQTLQSLLIAAKMDTASFTRVEKLLNRELISAEQFYALETNLAPLSDHHTFSQSEDLQYRNLIMQRFSVEQKVKLLEYEVNTGNASDYHRYIDDLNQLWIEPLNENQQVVLDKVLAVYFGWLDFNGPAKLPALSAFFPKNFNNTNRKLLNKYAFQYLEKGKVNFDYMSYFNALSKNDDYRALEILLSVELTPETYAFNTLRIREFPLQWEQLKQNVIAGDPISEPLLKRVFDDVTLSQPFADETKLYYQAAVDRFPNNQDYAQRYIQYLYFKNEFSELTEVLSDYAERNSKDFIAVYSLYLLYLSQGNDDKAATINAKHANKLTDAARDKQIEEYRNRFPNSVFLAIIQAMSTIDSSNKSNIVNNQRKNDSRILPLDNLERALLSGKPQEVKRAFTAYWRGKAMNSNANNVIGASSYFDLLRGLNVNSLVKGDMKRNSELKNGRSKGLVDRLIGYTFFPDELNRLLSAESSFDNEIAVLYKVLAMAYRFHGRAEKVENELVYKLTTKYINNHELFVLLSLLEQEGDINEQQKQGIESRINSGRFDSYNELLIFAEFYANAGEYEKAQEFYLLAAAKMASIKGQNQMSYMPLYQDISKKLPFINACKTVRQMIENAPVFFSEQPETRSLVTVAKLTVANSVFANNCQYLLDGEEKDIKHINNSADAFLVLVNAMQAVSVDDFEQAWNNMSLYSKASIAIQGRVPGRNLEQAINMNKLARLLGITGYKTAQSSANGKPLTELLDTFANRIFNASNTPWLAILASKLPTLWHSEQNDSEIVAKITYLTINALNNSGGIKQAEQLAESYTQHIIKKFTKKSKQWNELSMFLNKNK